ncbi:MAG: potassium-transporting ATPase subunit KdpA [Acidobacteriota bacterium]
MTANAWLQIGLFFGLMLALVKPLGWYMARVYEGKPCGLDRALGPLERLIYRACGVKPAEEMDWKTYAKAMLLFNLFGLLAVYALQRFQGFLPLNPLHLGAVSPDSSFNTAVSFATNTNWQGYAGENTMSYLTQMAGLAVQNFLSAASGLAVLVALIRGIVRREQKTIGNFWTDTVRGVLYILLPLSLLLALALVSQGVVQTLSKPKTVSLLQPARYEQAVAGAPGKPGTRTVTVTQERLPVGPVASQEAIKELGTNGGGFFNTNSAHPFENPTPLSNLLEMLALVVLSAGLCVTFGVMAGDRRQGWALLAAMLVILVPLTLFCVHEEQAGNPLLARLGVNERPSALQSGGNMEGKEVRFGITDSALWAAATTATSNGSVNSMHDSYTPLGGLVPLFLMQLGEVVLGGVGSGLFGMLLFVILAVFTAGLMVGRTPEYLGKKIEPYEMKMAALAILVMPAVVLLGTAVASVTKAGLASLANPGAHGFSEILYAFSSAGNNNGSAFAGLNADTPFYNLLLALAMLAGRFLIKVPVLAIAGSLAKKKAIPTGAGTLPTHTPLFIAWLVAVVIIVGGLTFFPALALGPIAERLTLFH